MKATVLAAVGAAVACAALGGAWGVGVLASQPAASPTAITTCTPVAMVTTVDTASPAYRGPDTASQPTKVTADIEGGESVQLIPPDGWMPASATDAELAYYNIPPRPSDPSALAEWTDEWVTHFSEIVPTGMCVGPTDGVHF